MQIQSNHNTVPFQDNLKYSCEKCNHMMENKSDLDVHIKTSHEVQNFITCEKYDLNCLSENKLNEI